MKRLVWVIIGWCMASLCFAAAAGRWFKWLRGDFDK